MHKGTHDYSKQKFGALTAIRMNGRNHAGKILWECLCENCNKLTNVSVSTLIRKDRPPTGCGCKRKGRRKNPEEMAINTLYCAHKGHSKRRKIETNLTKEQYKKFILDRCHYCNRLQSNTYTSKNKDIFKYNGIDRIDSNIGYIKNNCVTCCKTCNTMKMEQHYIVFLKHIRRIYENKELGIILGTVDPYK